MIYRDGKRGGRAVAAPHAVRARHGDGTPRPKLKPKAEAKKVRKGTRDPR